VLADHDARVVASLADRLAERITKQVSNGRPGLLTAGDVAERWQVTARLVYRLTREGKLEVVRVGDRYYRYRLEDVEAFEQEGGTDALIRWSVVRNPPRPIALKSGLRRPSAHRSRSVGN
jgi:excisionase family DNA binding protein